MKHIYLLIILYLTTSIIASAQVSYNYSITYLGNTGTGGNPQFVLLLNADNNSTNNSPVADFGLTLRVPNDYTIGNFQVGNSGINQITFFIDGETDQTDGTRFIQLQRDDATFNPVSFTHSTNHIYELVKFDLIAQNNATQVPTNGEIKIEDINAGINDTYFNINLTEDGNGTSNYLLNSNPSSFNFSSLNTSEIELKGISIFPNPVKNILIITGLETKLSKVEIYNISGQVLSAKVSDLDSVTTSALANGVYFAKLYTVTANKIIKFIKE